VVLVVLVVVVVLIASSHNKIHPDEAAVLLSVSPAVVNNSRKNVLVAVYVNGCGCTNRPLRVSTSSPLSNSDTKSTFGRVLKNGNVTLMGATG
jgi:hypothetical protein